MAVKSTSCLKSCPEFKLPTLLLIMGDLLYFCVRKISMLYRLYDQCFEKLHKILKILLKNQMCPCILTDPVVTERNGLRMWGCMPFLEAMLTENGRKWQQTISLVVSAISPCYMIFFIQSIKINLF